jgi:copper chaperone NosL
MLVILLVVLLAASGCTRLDDGPPPIRPGAMCASCGMDIADLKFASTRKVDRVWRAYDSIECLVADRERAAGGPAWLPDYETKSLLPESGAWILRGDFPSPMGGGLAAFADRAVAESLAVVTHGVVLRLAALPAAGSRP